MKVTSDAIRNALVTEEERSDGGGIISDDFIGVMAWYRHGKANQIRSLIYRKIEIDAPYAEENSIQAGSDDEHLNAPRIKQSPTTERR